MRMNAQLVGGGALLIALGLAPRYSLAQTPAPPPAPAPATATAAPAPEETPSCSMCHEQAKQFVNNPHARGSVKKGEVPNDVCTACHGDGAEHIAGGGDKTKISVPRGLAGANDTCMLCHDKTTDHISRRGGMHSNSDAVNCLSCHSIHSSDKRSPHLVAKPQLELCGTCHTQAASFRNKPYAHHLDRGGLACSSCHEPHGLPVKGERSLAMMGHLRTGNAGQGACLTCHAEKRGPWVFPHGGVEVGECIACHEPHGSTNHFQLKRANVYQLCIECHSPIGTGTLGSQPPSFHNLSLPRYQNCTTCHVAVHGSNRDPQLLK
jgi:DmsE family decaheme c-type cytochrome